MTKDTWTEALEPGPDYSGHYPDISIDCTPNGNDNNNNNMSWTDVDKADSLWQQYDILCGQPPGDKAVAESGEGGERGILLDVESTVCLYVSLSSISPLLTL